MVSEKEKKKRSYERSAEWSLVTGSFTWKYEGGGFKGKKKVILRAGWFLISGVCDQKFHCSRHWQLVWVLSATTLSC